MEENEVESGEKKVSEPTNKKKTEDRVKYENVTIEQELLGSVTTVNNPGLRTSARVIQKMKQDSIRPSTPPPADKKESGNEKLLPRTPSQSRTPKVIWSNYEKNLFFDAVNEFGKDFESISNFINSKIKRKSTADQSFKTKEQIRQIYYQTVHKLSKYLKFSDDVKKPAQELYALINYGEMRRKLAFVSEKNCMKMKDLVYKGHVTVRSKGKNIRIKTPPCKALRKLNQLDDWQEDINLPPKIEVCLKPANMEAWGKVQSIAQNPLVHTTVPLQKKLMNLIKTFQHKWRDEDTRLAYHSFAISKQANSASKGEAKQPTDDVGGYQEPMLCLCPPSEVVIHKPLVSITEFLSSFNICLNSYEQKIGVKIRGETLCNKRQRTDSGCEKKSPDAKKSKPESETNAPDINGDATGTVTDAEEKDDKEKRIDFNEISNSNQSNPVECQELLAVDEQRVERQDSSDADGGAVKKTDIFLSNGNDNAVSDLVPIKAEEPQHPENISKQPAASETKPKKKELKCSGKRKDTKREVANLKPLLDEETEKKIRKGWTILNASDISVGDLYITFGHDSKISLEYYWIKSETDVSVKKEKSSMPYNVNHVGEDSLKAIQSSKISNKLKHLLLIANLTERIKRKPCSCGHICEKGVKNKRIETETFVSNKTYKPLDNDNVFRQPVAPFRRQMHPMEGVRLMQNAFRYNQSRLMMKSRSLVSKQVVVQRLLPVQPGINQSYDVVTPQVHVRTLVNETDDTLSPLIAIATTNTNGSHIVNTVNSDSAKEDINIAEINEYSDSSGIDSEESKTGDTFNLSPATSSDIATIEERPFMGLAAEGLRISSGNCDSLKEDSLDDRGTINIDDDPGIQQLMEISLPSPAPSQCVDDSDSCSIPPMSPMRLIRDLPSDPKWLEENLNDYSLSSLLAHLDGHLDMNRDLDTMSVMNESSQDYMSKFAEIAASMQNDDKDL